MVFEERNNIDDASWQNYRKANPDTFAPAGLCPDHNTLAALAEEQAQTERDGKSDLSQRFAPEALKALRTHLDLCEDCSLSLLELKSILNAPEVIIPDALKSQLYNIPRHSKDSLTPSKLVATNSLDALFKAGGWAAAALIISLVGYMGYSVGEQTFSAQEQARQNIESVTPLTEPESSHRAVGVDLILTGGAGE